MRLADAASYFDRVVCADAFTPFEEFKGQFDLFDDSKRDGVTVDRRVLSCSSAVTVPTRRVVLAMGEYWIVGDDIHHTGYAQQLQARARAMHLDDVVRFLGFRHDVDAVLGELDLLVSCSHEEPFGISLIEAMGCRLPVVAASVGGIPEVIEHEVTGLLVPPRSPEALADAVCALLVNPNRRLAMGDAGRRRAERHFDAATHARNVARVYGTLLSPASTGRQMSASAGK